MLGQTTHYISQGNTPKQVEMTASGLNKMPQGFSFVLGLCVIFLGAGRGKYSGEFGAGY